MTTPTSRLSARATRPDKRSCFWRSAVRTRTVHLLIRRTLGPGMSEYLASRVRAAANVVIHEQTEIDAICGNHRIDEIVAAKQRHGLAKPIALCGRVRFHRRRPGGGLAAGGPCPRRQRLSPHRFRRRSVGPMAQSGSRPVSPGDDRARRVGRRRHPLRVHEARGICRRRRLAGGYLCPSLAVDRPLSSAGCRFQGSASTAWRCFKLSAACDSVPHSADNTPW